MKLKERLAVCAGLVVIVLLSLMAPPQISMHSQHYRAKFAWHFKENWLNFSSAQNWSLLATNVTPGPESHQTTRRAESTLSTYEHLVIQTRRKALIAKVCRENQEVLNRTSQWAYKFDMRRQILYCPIPKAGWSSWKRTFFYINGVINSTNVEIGVRNDKAAGVYNVHEHNVRTMKDNVYKFAFVRNPWDRLVSAYNNKAVDYNYSRILNQPCPWERLKPYGPSLTFTQFLTCIIDRVQFSRRQSPLDIHWTPQWQLCDFCAIPFDFIGHLETMTVDSQRVLTENDIGHATFPQIFASSRGQGQKASKPTSHSKPRNRTAELIHWYKKVPVDVLRKLQTLFLYDFLLHGYDINIPGWDS